jgi:rubrerythrin
MFYSFAPYQLAEIAMDIEESGIVFYSELAKRTTDENIKKVFTFLSEQEIQHKRSFEIIKNESRKTEDEGEYTIDLLSQMKTIARDIKTSGEKYLTQNPEIFQLSQAFDVGIQTETKSIEAYSLMKKQLIDVFASTLQNIILQEEQHFKTLTELKAENSI